MKKILVTGGAGFIGTHLCRALTKAGHDVHVLDIADAKTPVKGVKYIKGDVRRANDVAKAIQGVDAVYHFAAIVSVPVCQTMPLDSHETNLMGTCRVLEAIRAENVDRAKRGQPQTRIIFAGSSVVYGDMAAKGEPRKEEGPLAWPPSFYGAQKLGSEHAITLYHDVHGVPAVVFRFFNVYGEGQDPSSPYSGVISVFTKAIKEDTRIRLNGGGIQTRDFISVHDVAAANVAALNLAEEKCDGRAMNLGTGQFTSIRELAHEMMAASGRTVPTEDAPPRTGDVLHSVASIARARDTLGWTPQVSLKEGLAELL